MISDKKKMLIMIVCTMHGFNMYTDNVVMSDLILRYGSFVRL